MAKRPAKPTDATPVSDPDAEHERRVALISRLAQGVRLSLGDAPSVPLYPVFFVLARQTELLAAADPGIPAAVRDAVERRVAALVPNPEARETVLTDSTDPAHPYFLLAAPDFTLREYVQKRLNAPKPTSLLEAIARAMAGGPGDGATFGIIGLRRVDADDSGPRPEDQDQTEDDEGTETR